MIRALLLAILFLLIARALWRLVGGVIEAASGTTPHQQAARPVKLVRDPICGTWVPPREGLSLTSGATTHYFCSETCRARFTAR